MQGAGSCSSDRWEKLPLSEPVALSRARKGELPAHPDAMNARAITAGYATDRPGGFSDEEIAQLRAVSDRLAILADTHIQRQIAENVLIAYLGPQTGPMVLAGKIRRGSGDTINAVL